MNDHLKNKDIGFQTLKKTKYIIHNTLRLNELASIADKTWKKKRKETQSLIQQKHSHVGIRFPAFIKVVSDEANCPFLRDRPLPQWYLPL